MATEKLTDARVRSARPSAKRYSIMHSGEPGLELRVSPSGKKMFALRASVGGKDKRIRLGEYGQEAPRISLAEAERRAREAKARIDREGDYRSAEREAREAQAERRKFTVSDLADAWLVEQKKHLRDSTHSLYGRIIDRHIRPRFGAIPVDDLRRAAVREAVREIGEGHARTANSVKQIIAAMFAFAQDELEREVSNPASGMKGFALAPRTRALTDGEIKRWWEALENPDLPPGPLAALALKVALFSAQRAGEIVGMRDCELDLEERIWVVPPERTKSGRGNLVPLTPRLIGFIKQARALRKSPKDPDGRTLPFPPDAQVFGITRHALTRAQSRLVAKIGTEEEPFEAATVHDLRRSARTLLARERLGVSHDAAERLLSHQTGTELSRVYNLHSYASEKRRALEALDAELARIIAGAPIAQPDNVISFAAVTG